MGRLTCEWCGQYHPELRCPSRPRWTRRGFIALSSAAVIGTLLPEVESKEVLLPPFVTVEYASMRLQYFDGKVWRDVPGLNRDDAITALTVLRSPFNIPGGPRYMRIAWKAKAKSKLIASTVVKVGHPNAFARWWSDPSGSD